MKSHRGVQFRKWATARIKEYVVNGFTMNDELLKEAGGGNYFDELLARIRDQFEFKGEGKALGEHALSAHK